MIYPTLGSSVRDVALGWVEDWDDVTGVFLISLGQSPLAVRREDEDEAEFHLTSDEVTEQRPAPTRPGQPRFKFEVLKRYGAKCAVCDMAVKAVLVAAHIREKRDRGSDDARNGLVLCPTHHAAYDAGLFAINPRSLNLEYLPSGPTPAELRIARDSIRHLEKLPHPKGLLYT